MSKFKNFLKSILDYLKFVFNGIGKEDDPTWTKDSSYALVIAHDHYRDTYPVYTTNKIKEIFENDCADTVRFIVNNDATSEAFLNALKEGLNYRTFYFYENAHGNNKCIRMADRNVLASEIWEILKDAKNRIIGFFDSCYSGSMIETDLLETKSNEDSITLADYLINKFKENENLLKGNNEKPRIKLYSACANGVVTTYEPEISTKFASALLTSYKKTKGQTYKEFDQMLVEKGSYGNSPKMDPKYHVVPQIASYGDDFSNYEVMK